MAKQKIYTGKCEKHHLAWGGTEPQNCLICEGKNNAFIDIWKKWENEQ